MNEKKVKEKKTRTSTIVPPKAQNQTELEPKSSLSIFNVKPQGCKVLKDVANV